MKIWLSFFVLLVGAALCWADQPAAPKRVVVVKFDSTVYQPWMVRAFTQVMGGSRKIQVLAYDQDREELKRAREEFGLKGKDTAPNDIWQVSAFFDEDYHTGGGGGGLRGLFGDYFKIKGMSYVSLVATPYELSSGQLRSAEALEAKGQERLSSGSRGSVSTPLGAFDWDSRKDRERPEAKAFYKACLALRIKFEALAADPVPAPATKPISSPASSSRPAPATDEPTIPPAPTASRPKSGVTHAFDLKAGAVVDIGSVVYVYRDANGNQNRDADEPVLGKIKIVRQEGNRAFVQVIEGKGPEVGLRVSSR